MFFELILRSVDEIPGILWPFFYSILNGRRTNSTNSIIRACEDFTRFCQCPVGRIVLGFIYGILLLWGRKTGPPCIYLLLRISHFLNSLVHLAPKLIRG